MEEYNLSSSSIDNISQFSRIKRLVLRASQDEAFSSSRRRDGFRSSIVSASPILDEKRNTLYLIHTVLINVLTLHHGEEFCAAYLDIQTSTVLTTTISESTVTTVLPASTVTTTTITGTRTVTVQALSTLFISVTSTINVSQDVTQTDIVTITSTTTLAPQKRAAELNSRTLPTIPIYLILYPPAQISAACKCLNLPVPRTTSVITAIQTNTLTSTPIPVTTTVVDRALFIVTRTVVQRITLVSIETQTINNPVTVTSTSTTIVTVT